MSTKYLSVLAAAFAISMSAPAGAVPIYGVTTAQRLISFDSATPGTIGSTLAISGLQAGDNILGIDFRPANGVLYAFGSNSNLYTLNTTTATASLVGNTGQGLTGTAFGFDFNPLTDRIRVTSSNGENFRINPGTAAPINDTPLAFAVGDIYAGSNVRSVGSAYNELGSTLYGIDSTFNILYTQFPQNVGTINTVGALGVDTSDDVGFDIFGPANVAFASLTAPTGTSSSLYTIDLQTGAATLVGTIGQGLTLRSLAVRQTETEVEVPEPGSIALLALGLIALGARRRRRA